MNKLSNLIEGMGYNDIRAIEKDLYEGNIAKLIKQRKKSFERLGGEKVCPTCGKEFVGEADYTLIFGPEDFRKKAGFCGTDCLCHFVKKLKDELVREE